MKSERRSAMMLLVIVCALALWTAPARPDPKTMPVPISDMQGLITYMKQLEAERNAAIAVRDGLLQELQKLKGSFCT